MKTFAHKGCKIAAAKKVCYRFVSFVHSVETSFCPNLSKSNVQTFLDFWNPWGKVMEKVVSDLTTFAYKGCKIAAHFFFGKFCPTSRILLVLVLLSASVERCFVSRMRDFVNAITWFCLINLKRTRNLSFFCSRLSLLSRPHSLVFYPSLENLVNHTLSICFGVQFRQHYTDKRRES